MSSATVDIADPGSLSLLGRLRFLAKDSVLYGGAAALNKAFGLITFPLLARHFSVSEYGTIDYFSTIASLTVILFIFGQDSAVARFFYEYEDREQRRQIFTQSLTFQMGLLTLLIPLLWLGIDSATPWIRQQPEARTLLKLVLLQLPFALLINATQNILKWTFCRWRFLVLSIGSVVFSSIALLLAILIFEASVVTIFQVMLATRAIFGLVGLAFCQRWLAVPQSVSHLRELLQFAIPCGVICTIAACLPAFERTFITAYLGEEALGLFAAGAKIATLIVLPIQAFQTAWGPFSIAVHKAPNAALTYNWVLKVFSLGICLASVVLAIIATPIIQLLASERYERSCVVVFPIAMGLVIESIGWIPGIGIGLSKKTYLSLFSYGLFVAVSVVAIWGFIPLFGFAGVAWGTMLGLLVRSSTEVWLAQRVYPLPWAFREIVTLVLVTMIVGLTIQLSVAELGQAAGTIFGGVGVVGIFAFGWTAVFSRAERERIGLAIGRFRKNAVT